MCFLQLLQPFFMLSFVLPAFEAKKLNGIPSIDEVLAQLDLEEEQEMSEMY